jgi:hypothetical protein
VKDFNILLADEPADQVTGNMSTNDLFAPKSVGHDERCVVGMGQSAAVGSSGKTSANRRDYVW